MSFPPEVWFVIAESLAWDARSLLSLCQCNKAFHSALLRFLYRHIEVSTGSALLSFSHAISARPDRLAKDVRALCIDIDREGSGYFYRLSDQTLGPLRHFFGFVFEKLVNLENFHLGTTQYVLRRIPYVSLQCELTRLTIPCASIGWIQAAFSNQDSLTHVSFLAGKEEHQIGQWLAENPKVWPNIHTATGSPTILRYLSRTRPITHITVPFQSGGFNKATVPNLCTVLRQTSLTSFTLTGWSLEMPHPEVSRAPAVWRQDRISILSKNTSSEEITLLLEKLRPLGKRLRPIDLYDQLEQIEFLTDHRLSPHATKERMIAWVSGPGPGELGLSIEEVIEQLS